MGSRQDHSIGRWAGLRHTVSPFIPFRQQLPSGRIDRIRLALIRGHLCYVVGNVAFTGFTRAACAWSDAEAHRLGFADQLDALVIPPTAALIEIRRQGGES